MHNYNNTVKMISSLKFDKLNPFINNLYGCIRNHVLINLVIIIYLIIVDLYYQKWVIFHHV